MNFLINREEIAAAINFGKYPVVYVEDIDAARNEYGWNLGKVKIKTERGYYIHADLYIFKDEKKFTTVSYGLCLTDRFGWSDVEEMAENAIAPELKPNDKFVLVVGMKGAKKSGFVMMVETGDAQFHTSNPLKIKEDAAMTGAFLYMITEKN